MNKILRLQNCYIPSTKCLFNQSGREIEIQETNSLWVYITIICSICDISPACIQAVHSLMAIKQSEFFPSIVAIYDNYLVAQTLVAKQGTSRQQENFALHNLVTTADAFQAMIYSWLTPDAISKLVATCI